MVRSAVFIASLALLTVGAWFAVRPALRPTALAALDGTDASAPPAPDTAYISRAFYGRRLEPRDGILQGAGQTDRGSFARYSAATGTHPALWMTYLDLREDLPSAFTKLRADLADLDAPDRQTLPQIGLALNGGKASGHHEAETASGADDAAIANLCNGVRSLQRPVYLRIGYEFNGPWNGYQPAPYVAAFRRIAAAMHTCTPNVATVWNWSVDAELDAQAAGYGAETLNSRLQSYYPGDDAVDWWALNLFTPQGLTAPATKAFLAVAAASRHPVMIGESSPKGFDTTDAAVRNRWFKPYFDLIRASPGIAAFCYIDWNWKAYPQWADWGDARLEQAPNLERWYRLQLQTLPLHHAEIPALDQEVH